METRTRGFGDTEGTKTFKYMDWEPSLDRAELVIRTLTSRYQARPRMGKFFGEGTRPAFKLDREVK